MLLTSLFLTFSLSLCASAADPATADPTPTKKAPADPKNAATHYRKTFVILKKLKTDHWKWAQGYHSMPDDIRSMMYRDSLGPPTQQSRDELMTMGKQLIDGLAAASKFKKCNWYGPDTDYFNAMGDHLGQARQSLEMVKFRVRHLFETGKSKQAIDELLIFLALASDIGDGPTLFGYLSQTGLEREVLQLLGQYLPTLKRKQIINLTAHLQTSYRRKNLRSALLSDEKFVGPLFARACVKQPERMKKFFKDNYAAILGPNYEALNKANLAVVDFIQTEPNAFQRDQKLIAPHYESAADLVDLPLNQFDSHAAKLRQQLAHSDRQLFKQLSAGLFMYKGLSRLQKIRNARWQMWLAAAAYQAYGQTAFEKLNDPYGKGSFKKTANKGGFVLKTQLRWKDFDPKIYDESVRFYVGPVQPDQWAP